MERDDKLEMSEWSSVSGVVDVECAIEGERETRVGVCCVTWLDTGRVG